MEQDEFQQESFYGKVLEPDAYEEVINFLCFVIDSLDDGTVNEFEISDFPFFLDLLLELKTSC